MMRICSVSTEQFAGLNAMEPVNFDPKLTILFGKNESGKSTLINLIYSLLWKDCKVGKSGKADEYYSDKYFRNHFGPAQKKESTIYGNLVFEDEAGTYKLEKSWDTEGTVKLRTPENKTLSQKDYKECMEKVLRHKNGVFSEILFANQKSIEAVVKKLLAGKMESGEELSTVATTLLMDLNGVPSEAFLNKIQEKKDVLSGSWDFLNDSPIKGGKKKIDPDSILKAYNDLQTVTAQLENLKELVQHVGEYLLFLTDGKVSIQDLNRDLSSKLYSDDNQLTYELLSEGTKDVIALAFRLAAMDLLYPDGGGVIAFDDPFTDMDEDRRNRACELINNLSERNQVIFATCDKKYFDLLHGRVQHISRREKE